MNEWHPTMREIIDAVKKAPSVGLRTADIAEAVGREKDVIKRYVHLARKNGWIFMVRLHNRLGGGRFYPTKEAMDAGASVLSALMSKQSEASAQRTRELNDAARRRYLAKKAKPIHQAPPPAPPQSAQPLKKSKRASRFNQGAAVAGVYIPPQKVEKVVQVVYPPGIKVTKQAAPPDPRYHVDPSHRGEFSAEWVRLRGGRP